MLFTTLIVLTPIIILGVVFKALTMVINPAPPVSPLRQVYYSVGRVVGSVPDDAFRWTRSNRVGWYRGATPERYAVTSAGEVLYIDRHDRAWTTTVHI